MSPGVIFRLVLTLVFLGLAGTVLGQTIYLGMDRERLVGVIGEPIGAAMMGDREVLRYPNGAQVVLREGRIIEITRIPHFFSYQLYLEANAGVDPLGEPKVPQESSARLVRPVDLAPLTPPSAVIAEAGAAQLDAAPVVPQAAAEPPVPATEAPTVEPAIAPPTGADDALVEAATPTAMPELEAKVAEMIEDGGEMMPLEEPPSALARLGSAVVVHLMNIVVIWLTLFIAFRWEGLVTDNLGLVAVAMVDFAVRLAGAGIGYAILESPTLFGLEKFIAIPVMLVTVMKFTSATTIPTAVRITIGVTVASYVLGYLLVMIPLQFAFFGS